MKTKAKSVNTYELRLWSRKHYGHNTLKSDSIYNGCITELKTGKSVWFRSVAKMLTAIEDLYLDAEEKTQIKYDENGRDVTTLRKKRR
jgi:hypothetical protein